MGKRKLHEFIDNVEHKHCGKCNQWKLLDQFANCKEFWDKLSNHCKPCRKKKRNQRYTSRVQHRLKARQEAPVGFLVCLNGICSMKDPKEWLQSEDQFTDAHVRKNIHTSFCLKCRTRCSKSIDKSPIEQACKKTFCVWRKKHPCLECKKDPNHEHNYLVVEADHLPEFEKVKDCSAIRYWRTKSRGVSALKAELEKCQPLCRFHHLLQSQKRRHAKGHIQKQAWITRKRAVINAEKHKRGCCLQCKRVVKEGEECGFSFDHRDPLTKFKYNGKAICPSNFTRLPQALFDTQWPLEQAKCDLLCANCDKLKTFECKDGYRK